MDEGRRSDDEYERRNERSTISFPYMDLDAAYEVARAVYDRMGTRPCPIDELAAQMGQTVSGGLRMKVASAATFGLIQREGRGEYAVSELGRRILEPETERAARVDAFLTVPLFREIFERFRGQRLPKPRALESEMAALGVSSKQTDKARQSFERSARSSGFFDSGDDRLVRPTLPLAQAPTQAPTTERAEPAVSAQIPPRQSPLPSVDHPFIAGLLASLPSVGSSWPVTERTKWLKTAESIFDLIYRSDEGAQSFWESEPDKK